MKYFNIKERTEYKSQEKIHTNGNCTCKHKTSGNFLKKIKFYVY